MFHEKKYFVNLLCGLQSHIYLPDLVLGFSFETAKNYTTWLYKYNQFILTDQPFQWTFVTCVNGFST